MKKLFILVLLFAGPFIGCTQQDQEKYKEKAHVEETEKIKAELAATNIRAIEMEADLEKRHRFYQVISGDYQGIYTTASGSQIATKVKLIPSLPPYTPTGRIRTLDEITVDINNLYFNIKILHWTPGAAHTATGCPPFQGVRGDLEKGRMDAAQSACSNVYSIRIVDPAAGPHQKLTDLDANSANLAQRILAAGVSKIDLLKVIMQPSSNADEYVLELKRVK